MNRPLHRPLALDLLRSFEAVARHLSFSAAAQELHLTQPAISRQIKSLEEDLGSALFSRGTRRVALTSAGRLLLRTLEPLLLQLDATVRQIRMAQGRCQIRLARCG
jgi:LysR family glycine cleavage system transcriptional activator